MGLYAGYWALTVTGLKSGPMWVLTRAAMSCKDKTGWLGWSPQRLAQACRITERSLHSQIVFLSEITLLKPGDDGFRVVGWLNSEKFSEKFSKKEKNQKKESLEWSLTAEGLRPQEIQPQPIETDEERAAYREAVRRYFERESVKR